MKSIARSYEILYRSINQIKQDSLGLYDDLCDEILYKIRTMDFHCSQGRTCSAHSLTCLDGLHMV